MKTFLVTSLLVLIVIGGVRGEQPAAAQVVVDVVMAQVDVNRLLTAKPSDSRPEPLIFGQLLEPAEGQKLRARVQEQRHLGLARILSAPSMVTISGRIACMHSGGEQPIPDPDKPGGVVMRPYGTILEVLPVVTTKGKFYLNLELEHSHPNDACLVVDGTTVAGRSTHRVRTTVDMKDDHTMLIVHRHVFPPSEQVPGWLYRLPFFGGAARNIIGWLGNGEDLVILVRAHVVSADE